MVSGAAKETCVVDDPHSGFKVPDVCARGFEKIDLLVERVAILTAKVSEHTRVLNGDNGFAKRLRILEEEYKSAKAQVAVLRWLMATTIAVAGVITAVVNLV